MTAPLPPLEQARLEALWHYEVLDTPPEQAFDDLTHLAAQICGTSIAAITLIDRDRQWFKSRVGWEIQETSRKDSFCAHTILEPGLLLVPDATADQRFADNPFVISQPHIRFYAGVPLVTSGGQAVGTLCVFDTVPRQLDSAQQDALHRLARQALALLEARPDPATRKGQSLTLAATTALRDADNLKISEMRYRRLFESAKDGILILDAATGKIEDVNPYLCQLLGYAADDFLGKQLWEIGVFQDIVANQEAFRTLQAQEYIRYDDLPLEARDGQSVSVEFISNVYLCANKEVVQCNIRDISGRKRIEDLIRISQANLAQAQQIAHLGSWELDLANLEDVRKNPLHWSDEVFRIFGYQPGQIEASNENFFRAVHPDDRDLIAATMSQAIGESKAYHLDHRVLLPDGKERIVREQSEIIFDQNTGKPLKMVGTVQDITEHKGAETQLHFQKTLLEAQTEASLDGILVVSGEGEILSYNQRFLQMWEVPPHVVASGDDAPLLQNILEKVANPEQFSQKVRHLYGHRNERSHDEIFLRDGRIFDRYSAPIASSNGSYYGRVWYFRDVTEREQATAALNESKAELEFRVIERTDELMQANRQLQQELTERRRTEEALREAQQMLQLVINHIPQAIYWKDRNSLYLGCNYRLALDAGFGSPDQVSGRSDFEMPWANQAADHRDDDREVMETTTSKLNIEELLTKADGTSIWLRSNKIPLHDSENHVVGVLCSYEDITKQKQAEAAIHEARREADAANLAKSEFLSRMSHELRTPLNAILGFGQILENQELTPRQHEGISYILKGGRHLLGLINEVLDIARVEAGHIELSLEPVALHEVVPEVCALVQPLAEERHIRLEDNSAGLGRSYILADLQRFKQVLLNLLSNAIKYNRDAGHVEVLCALDPEGWVSIAVRDTGPGILPHDLPKLFTPFERLGAVTSSIEGTGLGLVLSQRLVVAMAGSLKVESILGQGTTFTLKLPQTAPPEEQVTNVPEDIYLAPVSDQVEPIYSVLCVEDNPSNLRLIEAILESRPEITLISAMQGGVGLDLARQHKPDLILLDLDLPDIKGSEVLVSLQQSASTRDIPVVIVSADATPGQIERLLFAGAKAYLTKPLDVGLFLLTLDQFLAVPQDKEIY